MRRSRCTQQEIGVITPYNKQMLKLQRLLKGADLGDVKVGSTCLLYTSPSPRDRSLSRMPSSA